MRYIHYSDIFLLVTFSICLLFDINPSSTVVFKISLQYCEEEISG